MLAAHTGLVGSEGGLAAVAIPVDAHADWSLDALDGDGRGDGNEVVVIEVESITGEQQASPLSLLEGMDVEAREGRLLHDGFDVRVVLDDEFRLGGSDDGFAGSMISLGLILKKL